MTPPELHVVSGTDESTADIRATAEVVQRERRARAEAAVIAMQADLHRLAVAVERLIEFIERRSQPPIWPPR